MNITIIGRKLTPRESFKERVNRKLGKLDRFFSDDADAIVTATQEGDGFVAEITVKSQGIVFRAEKRAEELFDAFEAASDSISKQIVKNKSKLEKKYRSAADFSDIGFPEVEEETEYKVARVKRFAVKPMSLEEAILQMNLLSHEFFMFRDIETEEIHVVYRRRGGDYGLLVPSQE